MLLTLSILAATVVLPTVAVAQDSPEFNNWGPGTSAPGQEGIDNSSSSSSASPGDTYAPYSAAPPSAAPAAPAPPIAVNGCSYDLRGNWLNRGRYTTGGNYSYSQYVYVRQYVGGYVYGQQDDGTAYYGRCTGSQVRFDVYYYGQYVGRQTGSVNGSYPYPLYSPSSSTPDASSSSAAPYFAPPPPYGGSQTASFNWRNSWGAGYETWSR